MIKRSVERRALPREVINLPAMLSFDGISGVHPCVVRDINAYGACLSTPYYMFARDFDLSFSGFHRTLGCRVVWRRATLSGVVFVLCRRAPKLVSAYSYDLAATKQPDGQITQNLSSPFAKNISVFPKCKSVYGFARLTRQEGRLAIVTNAGWDAVDVDAAIDERG
jgi:hypothetical protein